jgi:hypothetical protein
MERLGAGYDQRFVFRSLGPRRGVRKDKAREKKGREDRWEWGTKIKCRRRRRRRKDTHPVA